MDIPSKTTSRLFKRQRIKLHITSRCNLGCVMCEHNNFSEKLGSDDMSFHEADTIIKKLNRYFLLKPSFFVTGGEPLLNPVFGRILGLLRKNKVTVCTSFVALNLPKNLSGNTEFIVSVHGTQKIHDEVTGKKGAFEQMLKNLKKYKDNSRIKINYVILRPNIQELSKSLKFFSIMGLAVEFQHLMWSSREITKRQKKFMAFNDKDVRQLEMAIAQLKKDMNKVDNGSLIHPVPTGNLSEHYLGFNKRIIGNMCTGSTLRINHTGNLIDCNGKSYGNLIEKTPEELFNRADFLQHIRSVNKKFKVGVLDDICIKCHYNKKK